MGNWKFFQNADDVLRERKEAQARYQREEEKRKAEKEQEEAERERRIREAKDKWKVDQLWEEHRQAAITAVEVFHEFYRMMGHHDPHIEVHCNATGLYQPDNSHYSLGSSDFRAVGGCEFRSGSDGSEIRIFCRLDRDKSRKVRVPGTRRKHLDEKEDVMIDIPAFRYTLSYYRNGLDHKYGRMLHQALERATGKRFHLDNDDTWTWSPPTTPDVDRSGGWT